MLIFKTFTLSLLLGLSLTHASTASNADAPPKKPLAKIAIIIDDIGNNIPLGLKTVELQGKVTLAILPKTPGAVRLAKAGHASGKQIMLHAPMSNHQQLKLGPGALTLQMSREEFLSTLIDNINSIPHVSGVNNHMGSLLTTQAQPMVWLMRELRDQQLFFVDSLTSSSSIAYDAAQYFGIKSAKRDVFLDNEQQSDKTEAALNQLIAQAKRRGSAIGIGHPYPSTIEVLAKRLPQLEAEGIELVHASELLAFDPAKAKAPLAAQPKPSMHASAQLPTSANTAHTTANSKDTL